MKTKHTRDIQWFEVVGAEINDVFGYPENLDVHSLISAAPCMLEALEKCLPVLRLNKKNATADIVEEAIRKARGE
jgi:hypothetical protein